MKSQGKKIMAKKNLEILAKPLHDYNAMYQTSYSNRAIAIKIITAK